MFTVIVVCFILYVLFQFVNQKKNKKRNPYFHTIRDRFHSLADVQDALRKVGLEASQLIVGVDFTKSNEWTGKRSFKGRCLHALSKNEFNPYQHVINVMARTLEPFDADRLIPAYGFGDSRTTDRAVFPFFADGRNCFGVSEVLQRYADIAKSVTLSGPTSFAPLIRQAIEIVKFEKAYHILVIVADGQVSSIRETADAIVEASKFPLSIIMVGVGDGPWGDMERFDDELPQRCFDNFQFVEFNKVCNQRSENPDVDFAVAALMEIPEQYLEIKRLGYL